MTRTMAPPRMVKPNGAMRGQGREGDFISPFIPFKMGKWEFALRISLGFCLVEVLSELFW